jgi:hypothetical protein
MLGFFIYILLVFAVANLYYFVFSNNPNWKRTMLWVMLPFSAILFITAVFLSLIDSDDLIHSTMDFFTFLLFSNILLVAFAFFLLAIHNAVVGIFSSTKNYGTYVFVFTIAAFLGCPFLALVLYTVVSLLFGFGS